jgi:hypothetical protein
MLGRGWPEWGMDGGVNRHRWCWKVCRMQMGAAWTHEALQCGTGVRGVKQGEPGHAEECRGGWWYRCSIVEYMVCSRCVCNIVCWAIDHLCVGVVCVGTPTPVVT